MAATSRPKLTIVWSADTSDPNNVRYAGVIAEAVSEFGVTHIYALDGDRPNEVELVMLIAAALGAEVVEVNEHFRPKPVKARLVCSCGAVDRFSCICDLLAGR